MRDDTWAALKATPFTEVRRRAAIITEITGIAPAVVDGADRFAWNDGCGQSVAWYFPPDGRALLLTFDHETELNLYAEGDYGLQESLYRGVPEGLARLVRDRPEDNESLNLAHEDTGRTIHCAGGVFWFDGDQWRAADGFVAHCKQRGLDGIVESGFDYCLEPYAFGHEFTPETVVERAAADGEYEQEDEREAALVKIKRIFARHT